jgi:hypothetical protein
MSYWRKSAAQDNNEASYQLAQHERDNMTARLEHFEKAIETGSVSAMRDMAER